MAKCSAISIGMAGSYGKTKKSAETKAALKAYFDGANSAELAAARNCPPGKYCLGSPNALGKPSYVFLKGKKKKKFYCLAIINVEFVGECGTFDNSPKPETEDSSDCVKKISASSYRKFMKKVDKLPKMPKEPEGGCCLYKIKVGRGFSVPKCAGKCETGTCKTIVRINSKKKIFEAYCLCE